MLDAWVKLSSAVSVRDLLEAVIEQIDFREYLDDDTEGRQRSLGQRAGAPLRRRPGRGDRAGGVPGAGGPGLRRGRSGRRAGGADPADPARRQGAGVPGRLYHRPGRRRAAPQPLAGRRRGAGRGTTSVLCGPDAGQRPRLPLARLPPHHLRHADIGTPSRFLGDLPEALVSGGSSGYRRQQAKQRASSWSWSRGDDDDTASPPARRESAAAERPARRRGRGSTEWQRGELLPRSGGTNGAGRRPGATFRRHPPRRRRSRSRLCR